MFYEKKAKIHSVGFRLANLDGSDSHLPAYDNTKLTAYNTCNMWGTVRYGLHKAMQSSGRAMALECGSAMHELFAYVRLLTTIEQVRDDLGDSAALACSVFHGNRLFGTGRWKIIQEFENEGGTATADVSMRTIRGGMSTLETSGFYDDPKDKRRTMSNMEEAAIAYINRWRYDERIWRRDRADPTSDIGVEIPFDLVVTTEYETDVADALFTFNRRFTGKIDGIHVSEAGEVILDENKTAARLNDAWSMSFQLNTQPTGYVIAASVFTGEAVRKADIHGISIPMPKTYDYGGIIRERVSRQDYHIQSWVRWFNETARGIEEDLLDPVNALKFTHSCNRYFRPCSFIPLCDAPNEDFQATLDYMVTEEWSPLKEIPSGEE